MSTTSTATVKPPWTWMRTIERTAAPQRREYHAKYKSKKLAKEEAKMAEVKRSRSTPEPLIPMKMELRKIPHLRFNG